MEIRIFRDCHCRSITSVPKAQGSAPASFKKQFSVLRDKRIVSGLFITFFWIAGYQLMFTYLSPFLATSADLDTTRISGALLVCGIFAVLGSRLGGYSADRWGIKRTLMISLLVHAASLAAIPFAAATYTGALLILAIWGVSAWTTTPAQTAYLVSLSPNSSDLALSLNTSVLQLGIGAGSIIGGWVVSQFSMMNLGWIGAISVFIALATVFYSTSIKKEAQIDVQY